MSLFRCAVSVCGFECEVPNPPGGADAMRCVRCGDVAVLVDPLRPAFRCERCQKVFRVSGSQAATETCDDCGGVGRLLFQKATEAPRNHPPAVALSRGEMKSLAGELRKAFVGSPAGMAAQTSGTLICDYCNVGVPLEEGFLTGPISSDDTFPSLACGSCFESRRLTPWDGDTSQLTPQQQTQFAPVVEEIRRRTGRTAVQPNTQGTGPFGAIAAPVPQQPAAAPSVGELSFVELSSRAAARLWREPEFAEDLAAGHRKCDLCPATVAAGEGYLIDRPPVRGTTPPKPTGELASLSDAIDGIGRGASMMMRR